MLNCIRDSIGDSVAEGFRKGQAARLVDERLKITPNGDGESGNPAA